MGGLAGAAHGGKQIGAAVHRDRGGVHAERMMDPELLTHGRMRRNGFAVGRGLLRHHRLIAGNGFVRRFDCKIGRAVRAVPGEHRGQVLIAKAEADIQPGHPDGQHLSRH